VKINPKLGGRAGGLAVGAGLGLTLPVVFAPLQGGLNGEATGLGGANAIATGALGSRRGGAHGHSPDRGGAQPGGVDMVRGPGEIGPLDVGGALAGDGTPAGGATLPTAGFGDRPAAHLLVRATVDAARGSELDDVARRVVDVTVRERQGDRPIPTLVVTGPNPTAVGRDLAVRLDYQLRAGDGGPTGLSVADIPVRLNITASDTGGHGVKVEVVTDDPEHQWSGMVRDANEHLAGLPPARQRAAIQAAARMVSADHQLPLVLGDHTAQQRAHQDLMDQVWTTVAHRWDQSGPTAAAVLSKELAHRWDTARRTGGPAGARHDMVQTSPEQIASSSGSSPRRTETAAPAVADVAPVRRTMADVLPEDDWWRLYINPQDHAKALTVSPSDPGLYYDLDRSPGFKDAMLSAYRQVLGTPIGVGERMDSSAYERMHTLVTRNFVGDDREKLRWSGGTPTNHPLSDRGISPDILAETVAGRPLVYDMAQHDWTEPLPDPPPVTVLDRLSYTNAVLRTNYAVGEAPKLVDAVFDRYYRETGEAGGDADKNFQAIARAVRALHVLHPFSDANTRLAVQVLLPKLLLERGFHPVVPDGRMRLFSGGYSIEDIVGSLRHRELVDATNEYDQLVHDLYVSSGTAQRGHTDPGARLDAGLERLTNAIRAVETDPTPWPAGYTPAQERITARLRAYADTPRTEAIQPLTADQAARVPALTADPTRGRVDAGDFHEATSTTDNYRPGDVNDPRGHGTHFQTIFGRAEVVVVESYNYLKSDHAQRLEDIAARRQERDRLAGNLDILTRQQDRHTSGAAPLTRNQERRLKRDIGKIRAELTELDAGITELAAHQLYPYFASDAFLHQWSLAHAKIHGGEPRVPDTFPVHLYHQHISGEGAKETLRGYLSRAGDALELRPDGRPGATAAERAHEIEAFNAVLAMDNGKSVGNLVQTYNELKGLVGNDAYGITSIAVYRDGANYNLRFDVGANGSADSMSGTDDDAAPRPPPRATDEHERSPLPDRQQVRIRYADEAARYEQRLGDFLAEHPAVNAEVGRIVRWLWDRESHRRGELGSHASDAAGSVPEGWHSELRVVEHGNLRERMAMLWNAVSDADLETSAGITAERSQRTETESMVRMRAIAADRSLTSDEQDRLLEREYDVQRSKLMPDDVRPPLSDAEREHVVDERGRLRWVPASSWMSMRLDGSFQARAEDTGALVRTGTSGSAELMIRHVESLTRHGVLRVDYEKFRLALLGTMLPNGHHTYHEVMRGAALARPELTYDDDWGRYWRLAPLTEKELREHVAVDGRFPDEHALAMVHRPETVPDGESADPASDAGVHHLARHMELAETYLGRPATSELGAETRIEFDGASATLDEDGQRAVRSLAQSLYAFMLDRHRTSEPMAPVTVHVSGRLGDRRQWSRRPPNDQVDVVVAELRRHLWAEQRLHRQYGEEGVDFPGADDLHVQIHEATERDMAPNSRAFWRRQRHAVVVRVSALNPGTRGRPDVPGEYRGGWPADESVRRHWKLRFDVAEQALRELGEQPARKLIERAAHIVEETHHLPAPAAERPTPEEQVLNRLADKFVYAVAHALHSDRDAPDRHREAWRLSQTMGEVFGTRRTDEPAGRGHDAGGHGGSRDPFGVDLSAPSSTMFRPVEDSSVIGEWPDTQGS
jgi:hypothetical protein